MRADLADVTIVVDRSGSMSSCQCEAESGVNHFIEEQRKQGGECLFSLIQFDTEYEFVHKGKPIEHVEKYTLKPRGMTALLDAVGRAINETGERLSAMEEHARPGLVVIAIITDGLENSSREFSKPQIKQMIERQEKEYSWQFTFLGANQDAFAEARGLGIALAAATNYSPERSKEAFVGAAANVSRMRHAVASGNKVQNAYTDEERTSMAWGDADQS